MMSEKKLDELLRATETQPESAKAESEPTQPAPVAATQPARDPNDVDFSPNARKAPLAVLTVAAALAFGVGLRTGPESNHGPAPVQVSSAQVQLLATGPKGVRPLRSGERISIKERIGFTYANPGTFSSLTILGFDGEEVHWYYPEAGGATGYAINRNASSVRLPFDIALSEAHKVGKLTIVAAFDLAPDLLAQRLASGKRESIPSQAQIFELSVD